MIDSDAAGLPLQARGRGRDTDVTAAPPTNGNAAAGGGERRGPGGGARALVMSPHPDDDVISMGGTLAKLIVEGLDVRSCQDQGSKGKAGWGVSKGWVLRFRETCGSRGLLRGRQRSALAGRIIAAGPPDDLHRRHTGQGGSHTKGCMCSFRSTTEASWVG